MDQRSHFYVNRRGPLVWLSALCLGVSAALRPAFPGAEVWTTAVLPALGAILYGLILLLSGDERFYKTAIPLWMIAVYYGFCGLFQGFTGLMAVLCWVALAFYGVLYTQITCGQRVLCFLLPLLHCGPVAVLVYLHWAELTAGQWLPLVPLLPDLLLQLGLLLASFAIRFHPEGSSHPTWGDRVDGRRLRTLTPMAQVSPYIMVTRNTSTNYFTDAFEITSAERYIRQKRREGLTNFGLTHVLLASYVRTLAKYPGLNRFLAGQKVYSRGEDVQFCMTIKKEMSSDSPDTIIKVHLNPRDTAEEVYRKVNAAVEKVKATPLDSNFDVTARVLTLIPGVVLKFVVWFLRTLDYFGLFPKFLLEISPFHGSVFFTSMGSLGIPPIYHHLYDFGNLPVFGSFGCKRRAWELQEDGSVVLRKYIDFKFCMDERIVDGYYYAAFFKHFKRLTLHPESLDLPPEEVLRDVD